ncbi:hypothetical protein [Lactovum odontotermitis]
MAKIKLTGKVVDLLEKVANLNHWTIDELAEHSGFSKKFMFHVFFDGWRPRINDYEYYQLIDWLENEEQTKKPAANRLRK